ncbi:hypothetical protein TYRP_003145 [Tyrophagus putrescentiae]|nr:hypothetical protein TYRP_003145 [Tyrophagus putrescentiae]
MATFYLDSLGFYRISEHSTFDLVEEDAQGNWAPRLTHLTLHGFNNWRR